MLTVYSDRHRLRNPATELSSGRLVRPYESPERAEIVLDRVRAARLGAIREPKAFQDRHLLKVHDPGYLEFLQNVWTEWRNAGHEGEAIPYIWPPDRTATRIPRCIEGRLGYYALAADTSLSEGTWEAARTAADVALTAAEELVQGRSAFALTRPPGHHATRDRFGGYCFLNHAALAAQYLRDAGSERVTVLDVDFHHGNGTQDIFYARNDVLFLSLHGDPAETFPYYSGHADETGTGDGVGATVNRPCPRGTSYDAWEEALTDLLRHHEQRGADCLVVSLGVDTFAGDPISFFRLGVEDYPRLGRRIARLSVPTLFVLEGGYAVEAIGDNVAGVLQSFLGA